MNIARYIRTYGVLTKDNEIVPFWDSKLTFKNGGEDYSDTLQLDYGKCSNLVACLYDFETKTISKGIELDIYPKEKHFQFKIGDVVLFEKNSRKLIETKIVDIVYEHCDYKIIEGKNVESYYQREFPDIKFVIDMVYCFKIWEPSYVFETGDKTKWTHQIYQKA